MNQVSIELVRERRDMVHWKWRSWSAERKLSLWLADRSFIAMLVSAKESFETFR